MGLGIKPAGVRTPRNSTNLLRQLIESIKDRRDNPTIVGGKPVAVCSDVFVTVDLE